MDVRRTVRRGNELIARAVRDAPDEPTSFICECREASCLGTIELTPRDFESLTVGDGRFVVLPGHEASDGEEAVGSGPGYAVVETWSSLEPSPEPREVNAG